MPRILYFDCFAGVSGDMIVGAMVSLGVDFEKLREKLSTLGLSGYEVSTSAIKRSGIAATWFEVKLEHAHQPHRRLPDIKKIILESSLPDKVKGDSLRAFEKLAAAEAQVHGSSPDEVHFHEVGAVDSIIDIVGAMICIEELGVDGFACSPIRTGFGFVQTAHGLLPVPAPGTAELLRGIPVYAGDFEGEYVTPTGAAILKTICNSFGVIPHSKVTRIGYGAGSRDPKGLPNVLRLLLLETEEETNEYGSGIHGDVVVIETNIDDMNPQAYGLLMEHAFTAGALDVYLTPVQMKKNRPGILLTVVCENHKLEELTRLILEETTSLGVRFHESKRRVLSRRIEEIATPYGRARIKVALDGERAVHFQAEYDDCARLAGQSGATLLEVQAAANSAYRDLISAKKSG